MAQIIRNIKIGLVKIREEFSRPYLYDEELIEKLRRCIDLIDLVLPKSADCFGVELNLYLTIENWNKFHEVYKALRNIFTNIKIELAQNSSKKIAENIDNLYFLANTITELLLSIKNG